MLGDARPPPRNLELERPASHGHHSEPPFSPGWRVPRVQAPETRTRYWILFACLLTSSAHFSANRLLPQASISNPTTCHYLPCSCQAGRSSAVTKSAITDAYSACPLQISLITRRLAATHKTLNKMSQKGRTTVYGLLGKMRTQCVALHVDCRHACHRHCDQGPALRVISPLPRPHRFAPRLPHPAGRPVTSAQLIFACHTQPC